MREIIITLIIVWGIIYLFTGHDMFSSTAEIIKEGLPTHEIEAPSFLSSWEDTMEKVKEMDGEAFYISLESDTVYIIIR
jgi:hypothetical protein